MKANHQFNVLLAAEEAAGIQALRLLSNSGHILLGVLTNVDSPAAGKHEISSVEVPAFAKKTLNISIAAIAKSLDVPVLDARLVQNPEFAEWMDAHHIDILLNVHSLHRVCPEVIQAAKVGAFNLHPGPLPQYSGLNAPSWALYNEESVHGVTIHHITSKIDAGNIAYETQFPITAKDTGLTVSIKCAEKGLELIKRLLDNLSIDPSSVPSQPQNLNQRRVYKQNQIPGNGFIQWSDPAHKIDAFVRACNFAPFPSPWGEPKASLGKKEISILKTTPSNKACDKAPGTVGRMTDGKTAIATGDYWIILERVTMDGTAISTADFLTPGDTLISGP